MEYIRVTNENIEKEHICCAISNNNDIQVASKKAWLRERFEDGLVFLKSVERGKCFVEYIPAENAWIPITADGYMYIDCLWVAGSLKGHGCGADLLNACMEDSKNKDGILEIRFAISGEKLNISPEDKWLQVKIPQGIDLKVHSTSADVTAEKLEHDNILIATMSGKIDVAEVRGSNVDFGSNSGNIEIAAITADTLSVNTSSGQVECKSVEVDEDGVTVEYATDSGRFRFKTQQEYEKIGDLYRFGKGNADLKVQSSSGDLRIE